MKNIYIATGRGLHFRGNIEQETKQDISRNRRDISVLKEDSDFPEINLTRQLRNEIEYKITIRYTKQSNLNLNLSFHPVLIASIAPPHGHCSYIVTHIVHYPLPEH
jgi:hypothetical protein